MKKRLFSVLLALVMVFSLLPTFAAAASSEPVYLAFSSDVHNRSQNESVNRLDNWITTVSSAIGSPFDNMCFCGDLSYTNVSGDSYWNNVKTVIDRVEGHSRINGKGIYTTGNHEMSNGSYTSYRNSNAYAKKFTVIGEAARTDDYVVYCFGANTTNDNQSFNAADITTLGSYLSGAPTDRPIFIISHFPLHSYGSRSTGNSANVISTINSNSAGRQIYFIWGHNHTLGDTNYDRIITDKIGSTSISFTYCAAGCMCDTEKDSGSASVKGKGLVVKLSGGRVESMTYYDKDGKSLSGGGGGGNVSVQSVTVSPSSLTLKMGSNESSTLAANVQPANATNKAVTWSSNNSSVATVDASGRVTARQAGSAVITVTTRDGNKTAQCFVTVSERDPVRVSSVSVNPASLNLKMGANESAGLTANVQPSNADDRTVTWSSSDPTVATVDGSGRVTAIKAGNTTIEVRTNDGNKTARCFVTVNERDPIRVSYVSVNPVTLNLKLGANESASLTATVQPSNADDKAVTWSSSDPTVATVDESGRVTAIKAGSATITVRTNDGGKTASCTVTVEKADEPPQEELLLGDVNGDGRIDSDDAMLVLRYDVRKIDGSALNLKAADVNGDGRVDSDDAMLILRYDVRKITSFPAAKK